MNFLLVDDDPDDSLLFKEVLHDVNSAVGFTAAENGKAALDLLRSGTQVLPHIIFLDLNMPLMNGKECLHELKQDPELMHIPVIIYTTSSQSRDIEETMMGGALCFITKPTGMKDLRNILTQITASPLNNLEKTVRNLSNTANTFIVC